MHSLKFRKEGHLHKISVGRLEKNDEKITIYVLNKQDGKCPWDMEVSSCNKSWYLSKMEGGQVKNKSIED